MPGRGGSRHRAKPFIETGLLMRVLMKHQDLLVNFKGYETLSRNNGVDPKGLLHALDFINDVLELEPTAEIHAQPLRNSLLAMLTEKPQMNDTAMGGSLWVHMRSERINVVLFHVRRLARSGANQACVSALSGVELSKLQNTLRKVVLTEEEPTGLPLQKGAKPLTNGEEPKPLKEGNQEADEGDDEEVQPHRTKKLKVNPSDVSCDSKGFPSMLKTPPKHKEAGPSRLLKKRVGQAQQVAAVEADPDLRGKLGLERKQLKRPAAAREPKAASGASVYKRPASQENTLAKGKKPAANKAALEGPGPWVKLQKVSGSKPERCYVLGTKVAGEVPRLIVEVTKKMTKKYSWVLDRIIESLEKENLSKEQAKELRTKLCQRYP